MAIYVPNIDKWVSHYTSKSANPANLFSNPNSFSSQNNVGLASESFMSVSKVEPTATPPTVPATGITPALRSVSESEGTLQQAMLQAKRSQIENRQAMKNSSPIDYRGSVKVSKKKNNNNKKKKKPAAGKKNNNNKKKQLFGTPGDIFKTKVSAKRK